METIESLSERLEVLENQTRAVKRRLHCWRGIACGLLMVGLPLASGITAQDESAEYRGMRKRLAALEYKLQYVDGGPNEVVITGANLRIVNGLGSTESANGLGNLIVGYNEARDFQPDKRTGSHNVVVGVQNNFSSFGGLVVGWLNEISGGFSSVSGGRNNIASGELSSVSGGTANAASGELSSVSGGFRNTASGELSSVSGGTNNIASGEFSSVSGGAGNAASDTFSSVSGGAGNTASGVASSISGGVEHTASGRFSSVSGGRENLASGISSSVSGGLQRTAPAENNWAAGPLFAAQ